MKIEIDTIQQTLLVTDGERVTSTPLFTPEAFKILSHEWLRVGWNQKHIYGFTWFGRPVIQLPEDMIRAQEVIFKLRPDVILETGIAHGGSLIFYASLCKLLNKGRVIGIDIEIRPHNRQAIESHPLFPLIQLIEADSVGNDALSRVRSSIRPGEAVLVLLDSCHTKSHVLKELEAYHTFVSPGSYIVATDGIMRDLADVPRGQPEWRDDNPCAAAAEFLRRHPEFELAPPPRFFDETLVSSALTHWPDAWLRRKT